MLSKAKIQKTLKQAKFFSNDSKYKEAIKQLSKIIKEIENTPSANKYSEELFDLYKQLFEALVYSKTLKNIDKTEKKLRFWAGKTGKADWVELEILEAQIRNIDLDKNPDKAAKFAKQYQSLMNDCLKKNKLEVAVWAGNKYLKLIYYSKELSGFEKASKRIIAIAKENKKIEALLWIYHHLGMIYMAKNDPAQAKKYLQKSLDLSYELNQRDGIIWNAYNLGLLNMNEEGNQEAVSNYIFQSISAANELEKQDEKQNNILRSYLGQINDHLMQFNRLGTFSKVLASEIHDIKNILTGTTLELGNLKFLAAESPNKEIKMFINGLIEKNNLLTNKVKEMLSYLRRQDHHNLVQEIDLFDYLNEFKQNINSIIKDNSLDFQIVNETGSDTKTINISPMLFYQALLNLVINAVEAMSGTAEKHFTIFIKKENEKYYLICQDNGPGVPHKLKQTIFEPFFTTKKEGTGIGLFIIKKQLQEIGMDIKLLNSDSGAVFWIGYF